MSSRRLNSCATLTASWPVIASATSRISVGWTVALQLFQLLHHAFVDLEAAGGVDDDRVLALVAAPARMRVAARS